LERKKRVSRPFVLYSNFRYPKFSSEHTHEEAEKYFKDLRTKLEQGIEINDDILAYKTKYANLIFVVYDLGIMFITLRLSDHFSFLKLHHHITLLFNRCFLSTVIKH